MMLGKSGRGRHPMRRTTSMSELAPPCVLEGVAEEEAAAEEIRDQEAPYTWANAGAGGRDWLAAYCARAAARARAGHRRNSADCAATETAAFLRACGLCSRRLGPGRDTFMYKGDTAFCSLECRQQHITQEEWKEKCALTSMKDQVAPVGGSGGGGGGSETAETGGAVAAA